MTVTTVAHVRCLAYLHTFQQEHGRPASFDFEVPAGGLTAVELAERIGLPTEHVEGLFLNNTISGLDAIVRPGDRVAFVPLGTPASHPSFFGPFVTRRAGE